ncbi:MAG: glycosyltransferase family 39 protein [Taibaiella sp.]|nr:glycosyltransferase family 39 protein [Taibaiella sp.]
MPKVPFWVFILIAILYFTAVRVDTMDVDASQYAEMSRELMLSDNYLHLYDRGIDYLDKPPLLFWLSAGSMKIFGINNFGYKLPSILFALWAIWATYRLGRLLYGDTTARMAALILATCQGMFLMTNDVRCDTILMSCVITALWLIQEWVVSHKLLYLLGGSAAIALGMMTKGPIALMVPAFCFVSDWLLKRQWKNFFSLAYIPALIVIAVLLIPMSIGLYQQFDMHPEKIVNGTKGISGLRFFYWTQSFGRITGESPWNNGAKIDFLLLNMLWSFLPWILLFITALVINVADVIRQRFRLQPQQEWITTGGFLLAYIALGSSAYQLPHYIFVVFPLAAVLTAHLLHSMIDGGRYQKLLRIMSPVHTGLMLILLFAVLALSAYVFDGGFITIAAWSICLLFWLYLAFSRQLSGKLFWLPAVGMFIVNIFLTNNFYYTLLHYQVGSQAGRYIRTHNIAPETVSIYRVDDPMNAIQFYAQGSISSIDTLTDLNDKKYLLTMKDGLNKLSAAGIRYSIAHQGDFYKVSELTLPFLNPKTRSSAVKHFYLVRLN